MTSKEFFDFAYDEYKSELSLAYSLYQRAGLMLTAEVVIGGASVSIARIDLLPRIGERWDIFMLHIAVLGVIGCLLAGVFFLFLAALPRDYPKLNKVFFWSRWRQDYWKMLVEDDPEDEERNVEALGDATQEAILEKLADAQTLAAYLNQERLRAFSRGSCCLALAVVCIVIQGLFALLLKLNGV